MNQGTRLGLVTTGVIALLATGIFIKSIEFVSEGTVAVVYSTNGIKDEPLTAGRHVISPFEKTVEYPIRNQTLVVDNVAAMTSDGKKFAVDVRYQYETNPKKVVDLYKKFGKQDLQEVEVADKTKSNGKVTESHEAVKSISLTQDIQKVIKEVIGQYTLDDVYRTKPNEINAAILKAMIAKEESRGFKFNDISIGVPELDDATQAAMDAKVQETQTQQLKEQQLQTAKIESEQKKVVAEGEAEKKRIEAQASADALLLKARAEAEANTLKQQTLTAELIQSEMIKAWDGALPTIQGSDVNSIIQMPKAE